MSGLEKRTCSSSGFWRAQVPPRVLGMSAGHVHIVRGNVPGLFQTEGVAAGVDNFPQEHRDGDGINVVFDQEQTHPPDKGVEICMGTLREIKERFVHICLPRGT